ncbi:MAG: hypothetical protein AB1791_09580, partial [Chloroflexota bacterium]
GLVIWVWLWLVACQGQTPARLPADSPTDGCLTCHTGIEEISPSHRFSCVACHGGDRLALDEETAHSGLRGGRNPSDFSVVEASCGGCHNGPAEERRDHIHRVLTSLQATYAGAIAQVGFAFGTQPDLTARQGMVAVADPHVSTDTGVAALTLFQPGPAAPRPLQTFAANCLTCHVGGQPQVRPYYYRATGCAACHVVYENDGLYRGNDPTIDKTEPGHGREHRFTTAIPYYQCNHCHNRGNYSLAQMHFLERTDLANPAGFPKPTGFRLKEYYQPIAQFTLCEWKLDCVDCHTNQQVMGDGDIHSGKAETPNTQCKTCHGTLAEMPSLTRVDRPDHPAVRSAALNPNYLVTVGDVIVQSDTGDPFGWVQWDGQKLIQTAKITGQVYEIPLVMGSACQQRPEEQESRYCHECHAMNNEQ